MITPTPWTAAAAGVLSALVWPMLWQRYGGDTTGGTMELVIGTLLAVALPAHALVVGMGPGASAGSGRLEAPLLKRIGAWLAAALVTTLVAGPLLR